MQAPGSKTGVNILHFKQFFFKYCFSKCKKSKVEEWEEWGMEGRSEKGLHRDVRGWK